MAAMAGSRLAGNSGRRFAGVAPPPPPPGVPRRTGGSREVMFKLQALAKSAGQRADPSEARGLCQELAPRLAAEWSAFTAVDIVHIVGACGRLLQRHRPLMDAAAVHALRGLRSYPPYAVCNVANGFARLGYTHRQLLDSVAAHMAQPSIEEQLSSTDIACLVFAYAELTYRPFSLGPLLEACSRRLRLQVREISGPNCATIANSYARLGECNPELFETISRALVHTDPGSFQVFHFSIILNALGKCQMRRPQLMHLVASYMTPRVAEMSPQNVSNASHAFARLELYDHDLFQAFHERVQTEDLGRYKLYELAILSHSFAKLRSGSSRLHCTLFDEFAQRGGSADRPWEPRTVAQVLDAMRRRKDSASEALTSTLIRFFVQQLGDYTVHQLTQTAWCLVELGALERLDLLPPGCLPLEQDELASVCLMRLAFGRLAELERERPYTPTQLTYVQQLVRAYHYGYEVEYGLQPPDLRTWCRTLFNVPTAVASSAARPLGVGPGRRR